MAFYRYLEVNSAINSGISSNCDGSSSTAGISFDRTMLVAAVIVDDCGGSWSSGGSNW